MAPSRTAVLPALCGLLLLPVLTTPAAAGRRPVPDVRGSYFGNFVSSSDTLPGEVNLFLQSRSRVGGDLRIGSRFGSVMLNGAITANRRLRLAGDSGMGRNRVHFRLTGALRPASGEDPPRLEGRYRATGAIRESGSFQLVGSGR